MFLSLTLCVLTAAMPGEASFLKAAQAEQVAEYSEAAEHYLESAAHEGALAAFARIGAARNLARIGKPATGAAMLDALLREHDTPWYRLARFERAMIAIRNGDPNAALTGFDEALNHEVQLWWLNDYRWRASEAYLAVEETRAKGYAFFRETARTSPFSKPRMDAAALLAASPDPEDRMAAALALIRARKFSDAARLGRTIAPAVLREPAMVAQWKHVSGAILLGQKDDAGGAILERVAEEHPESPWARAAMLYLVRTLVRNDRYGEALAVVERIDETFPESDEAFSARYAVASGYGRDGRVGDAESQFDLLLRMHADHPRVSEALLELGHLYRTNRRDPDALDAYARLRGEYPRSSRAVEAAYWMGVLLDSDGEYGRADAEFENASGRGIGLYYGHRSSAELGEAEGGWSEAPHTIPEGVVAPIRRPAEPLEEWPNSEEGFERLRFFAANGLPEAEWEMAALIPELESPDGLGLYHAIGETGNAYSAMQVAATRGLGVLADGTQNTWRLRVRFPRAYWDHVRALGRETGVDPYLILSVARQESTYRPALTSWAGAQGVMQVMPRTATWLADVDERVSREDAQRLTNPRHSLRLGAVYLSRMLERYDGNVVYAVAAYNAGPGNCDKWVKRHRGLSTVEFIEMIPFSETQNYVKRVLANYMTYHSIYPPALGE